MPKADEVIARLREMANPDDMEGMARYGINVERSLGGIASPRLQKLARELGRDHSLAEELWASGIREARLLACMMDDPKAITEEEVERRVAGFDSWDLCDCCCGYLLDKTPFAYEKASEWARREEEFVKRAGFSLMAYLAVHDKKAPDERFERFFPEMEAAAGDDRNYVRKAVNWALRQAGKRNLRLNALAIESAERMKAQGSRSARWIAADALKELRSEAVQRRLATWAERRQR